MQLIVAENVSITFPHTMETMEMRPKCKGSEYRLENKFGGLFKNYYMSYISRVRACMFYNIIDKERVTWHNILLHL